MWDNKMAILFPGTNAAAVNITGIDNHFNII